MKKFLLAMLITASFAACNDAETKVETKKDSPVVTPPTTDTTRMPADTTLVTDTTKK